MKKLSTLLIALFLVTATANAQSNSASTTQTGLDQEASINQSGSLNSAIVDQSGKRGEVILTQTSFNGSFAMITQKRDDNTVYLDQVGNNVATITQTNVNSVVRNVDGTSTPGVQNSSNGFVNYLSAVQAGHQNKLNFQQLVGGNTAIVMQGTTGGDNINNAITLDQSSADNYAYIHQTNDRNSLSLSQLDSGSHFADVIQFKSNTATVTQNGFDQSATVYQFGVGNTATVTQSNAGNTATITQSN